MLERLTAGVLVWNDAAARRAAPIAGLVLCLAWLYLAPGPAALLGAAGFAALAWRWLDRALCVLPLAFPFWYVPKPLVGHAVFPLSEIALAICLAVAIARALAHERAWIWSRWNPPAEHAQAEPVGGAARAPWRPELATAAALARQLGAGARRRIPVVLAAGVRRVGPWVALGAGLLLLGGALGVIVARAPRDALRAFRWEIVEPLVYLALVVACVRERIAARLLAWSFLSSAVLVGALAYVQVLWLHVTFAPLANGNHLVRYTAVGGGVARATAIIYGSSNSLGAWLERALPLALALGVAARGLDRRERIMALGCAIFLLPPLLWSGSRGAQVGAAVACVLVLIAASGLTLLAGALATLAALLALWQRNAILRVLLHGHGGTGEARLLVWLAALHMIRDHPLVGIGPDQFLYYYSPRYTNRPYWITHFNGRPTTLALDPTLSHPHDLLLDLWLSVGVAGLTGFALVLGNFWLRCARLWRAGIAIGSGRWPAALALGIGASVFAGVVHGLVDSAYFEPDLALAFWMSVALLVLLERGKE